MGFLFLRNWPGWFLECWEQALREGDGLAAYSIKTAPEFDFMHGDSRYQEMPHRLDLAQ